MDTVYIPLGNDCSIAYQLDKLGLRKYALPFDWILTPSMNNVIMCLEDNFSKFFDNLKVKNQCNFSLLDEHWDDTPNNSIRVINEYGFHFVHDFTSLDDLPEVKEKYLRRIERYNEIVSNKEIKKVFIRLGKEQKLNLDGHTIFVENKMCSCWKKNEIDWLSIFTNC
jgi:hypothetical protein